MNGIEKYLKMITSLATGSESFKTAVKQSFKSIVGVEIKDEQIIFKDGILKINCNPVIKNEMSIKRARLLDDINKQFSDKKVYEIK